MSRTLTLAGEDSILSVDGDLALSRGVTIDFAAYGGDVPRGWIPVAAASGTVTAGDPIYARNAGVKTNCATLVVDGVLYITPTCPGTILILK